MECVEEAERAETETSVENKQKLHNQIQGLEAQLHNLHTVHTNIHTQPGIFPPQIKKSVSYLIDFGECDPFHNYYILLS